MGTWKMDRNTALHIVNNVDKYPVNTRIYFDECEKCGAWFFTELGHKCEDTIELQTKDLTEEEKAQIDCDILEVQ